MTTLLPADNKFHIGNISDGKHYWLTPPELLATLGALHGPFDFDPCPFPKPDDFDGLTCEWGACNYVNPPFGSILHQGPDDKKPKKKGPTAWVRKAIAEAKKGKRVTLVYPVDKWLLMLLATGAKVSNLGDVRWHATEDGCVGKGTGRHIACFVLDGSNEPIPPAPAEPECSTHPDAPHGFDRNGSHNNDRHTCDCEGWEPEAPPDASESGKAWLHNTGS